MYLSSASPFVVTGNDPAANAETLITVPNGLFILLCFRVTLVAGAGVANREVTVTIDDGASTVARFASGVTHVASEARGYDFLRGYSTRGIGAQGLNVYAPLPDVIVATGYRIQTVTTNLQAADDYAAPRAWLLRL